MSFGSSSPGWVWPLRSLESVSLDCCEGIELDDVDEAAPPFLPFLVLSVIELRMSSEASPSSSMLLKLKRSSSSSSKRVFFDLFLPFPFGLSLGVAKTSRLMLLSVSSSSSKSFFFFVADFFDLSVDEAANKSSTELVDDFFLPAVPFLPLALPFAVPFLAAVVDGAGLEEGCGVLPFSSSSKRAFFFLVVDADLGCEAGSGWESAAADAAASGCCCCC